ncbi:hypothetical protein GCM10009864_72620 [Streptomyces lunalinharesii]|uniref:Uncharacterized protein n=1 Tax=Streptomyces lunalinharesii TaxID=333384 RepID=A0ABN3SZF3_9ACTN
MTARRPCPPEKAGEGLRAKDVCQALGPGTEPRHTEGIRAKLKRLVNLVLQL